MDYRFHIERDPGLEAVRVFREGVRGAVAALQRYSRTEPEELHTARKEIKKLRSLLRLLRKKVPGPLRKGLDKQLREANRRLSGRRDLEALAEVCRWLGEKSRVQEKEQAAEGLRKLRVQLESESGSVPLAAKELEKVKADLDIAERKFLETDLTGLHWKSLHKACRRQRRRTRRAKSAWLRKRDAEALHEWRKQAKHFLHHLKLLSSTKYVTRKKLQKTTETEKLLGAARDYALLQAWLSQKRQLPLTMGEDEAVRDFVKNEQNSVLRLHVGDKR